MSGKILYSIGYEKAGQRDFIDTLKSAGIATLLDIRERPLSRRAGFSKRQLQAAAEEAGIRYVHLRSLGTPPEGREAGHSRDWERFWRIVEEQLCTPEGEFGLQEAAELALASPVCLVCYEADWHICHRRRVAEILAERHGFEIRHLAIPGLDLPKMASHLRG